MSIRHFFALTLLASTSSAALAAESATVSNTALAHMAHMETPAAATTSGTQALIDANTKMHKAMTMEFTGDTDADFVRGMIPHHQGAIDMAKAVIAHGTDPDVKMFANDIIKAQDKEIRWMRDWLELHGPKTDAAVGEAPVSMDKSMKAVEEKVQKIEERVKAMATSSTAVINAEPTTKAETIAKDMLKEDTEKLMNPVKEVATTVSETTPKLMESLDPMDMGADAYHQPGMDDQPPAILEQ